MEDMLFVNFKDERISDIPKDVLYLILQGITLTPHWELLPFKADVARLLKDYFYSGGLAESFLLLDKRTWHQSLYDKILLSDIVVRNHIRNERSLRLMARKLAESVMQPTSVKHILSEPDTKLLENLVASQLV